MIAPRVKIVIGAIGEKGTPGDLERSSRLTEALCRAGARPLRAVLTYSEYRSNV
jgi:hypothetical protein